MQNQKQWQHINSNNLLMVKLRRKYGLSRPLVTDFTRAVYILSGIKASLSNITEIGVTDLESFTGITCNKNYVFYNLSEKQHSAKIVVADNQLLTNQLIDQITN